MFQDVLVEKATEAWGNDEAWALIASEDHLENSMENKLRKLIQQHLG
jgi:hypothetical protein